ncbi:peptidoglycan-binding domain-containing protein, partial [Fictibacillus phosphorivorans]|uniref:peptidoglycan-binding domain-containing protein n=2 Tax=Fictibacillus TaxID=1329200 RepID=UPI00119DE55C
MYWQKNAKNITKYVSAFVLALALLLGTSNAASAVGKNAKGPDVYAIQSMLKSLGSYSGKINGYYNASTVKGVKYFQKSHGLPVTGSVDARTYQSILYAYSSLKLPKVRQGG